MNEMKKYVNAIERSLRLDRPTRLRVMNDLASDLQSRLDAGTDPAQIRAELGSPQQVAAQFNAAFPEHRDPASPWRWAFLAATVALLLGALGVPNLLLGLLSRAVTLQANSEIVGAIGGADGPTAIFVTSTQSPIGVAYIIACLAVFLLLGWCRRGGYRRYWLPIALCGGWCAIGWFGTEVWQALEWSATLAHPTPLLASILLQSLFTTGTWSCLAVLILAALALRQGKAAGKK